MSCMYNTVVLSRVHVLYCTVVDQLQTHLCARGGHGMSTRTSSVLHTRAISEWNFPRMGMRRRERGLWVMEKKEGGRGTKIRVKVG